MLQRSPSSVAPALAMRSPAGLPVSTPGDPEEREASDVADRMMAPSAPATATRMSAAGGPTSPSLDLGTGQPLDAPVRAFFEPRFGMDLGAVRIHTGPAADTTARRITAIAFTHGRDIGFRAGHYAPHTERGRHLLAHELTHVAQQRKAGSPRIARQAGGEAPATASSIPRPPVLPKNESVELQPIELPPEIAATIPEGKVVLVVPPAPPELFHRYGQTESSPSGGPVVTAVGAATIENMALTAKVLGFKAAPGGNAIGLVGFRGVGIGKLRTPGHTAVYVRVNGQIVATRGFVPNSFLEALIKWRGIESGKVSVPGAINTDASGFLRDGARVIEYPVAEEVALRAKLDLPPPGTPPEGFAQRYTARPGVKGEAGVTNCVGFGCEFVESRLGGKVGAEKVGPVMEPVDPAAEGLQGRYTRAAGGKGGPVSPMPGASGPAVKSGIPTSLTVLKWGGRLFLVGGGVLAIHAVVQAPPEEKARTAAVEGGGFLAGFVVGAGAGLLCGPGAPVCSVVVGLVAGIAGAVAGKAAAKVAYEEGVGDADTVRAWLRANPGGIASQSAGTKIQMILALMTGWIDDGDVAAIDQICASVTSAVEAQAIRGAVTPQIVPNMTSIGQRTQVRVSLSKMPE